MPRRARGERPAPDAAAATDIAVRFLGTRPRTRWELERRLSRAGVAEDVAAATLERLAGLGYVDDLAFARWWAEQRDRHSPRGRRMIEAELRQRGVPRDVIEAYRGEHAAPDRRHEDAGLPGDETERAHEALARHLRGRPMPADRAGRARIGQFLLRRGFDTDAVRAAIRDAGAVGDEADDGSS